ncbi:phosphoribosylamine--glycine ligase [Neisseriaceae bacterium PsAf]|nr:phosphoribosylamine--glycine ligase [Neisseriaceae bacterium PsAf]MCV2503345.1 phosphoribosylamine--glycine ligase [Neisseriaceae bacterium]
MNVLVIGSGGREHALAWKIAQSDKVSKVFVAPGNAGTEIEPKVENINLTQQEDLIQFCQQKPIDLTVVGPEAPLAEGIVDAFRKAQLKIFGPTQFAAQLESSKDFAKQFMQKYHIPTAHYQTFSNIEAAKDYVLQKGAPIVIKADGLAAGKGVVVAMSIEEANQAIEDMLLDNKLGDAGAKVVIEDFLEGVEASFIVMVDGEHILPMATSQDHKRLLDQDQGPNTGGMGAYSPALVVTESTFHKAMKQIIEPTVRGMQKEGHPFTGFLYAGLMIDSNGDPYTVEFNCRFGDPETQPIMSRLETDIVDLLEAACDGRLDKSIIGWDSRTAVGVVLAAENYPQSPKKGDVIQGLEKANQIAKVFHAGTALKDGKIVTNGGRVLCVVGLGNGIEEAKQKAYAAIKEIHFDGMQYRTDIADKAVVA